MVALTITGASFNLAVELADLINEAAVPLKEQLIHELCHFEYHI